MTAPVTIMVAPNGARRGKADHPELPVSIAETARTVAACAEAGASAAHVHVRDSQGRHILDADAYREAVAAIGRETSPDFVCQITTEAVGRYTPEQQIAVVRQVRPRAVSVGLRELAPSEAEVPAAADFYAWTRRERIAVQHIVYDTDDLSRLLDLARRGVVDAAHLSVLYVLGRYTPGQESDANLLRPFLDCADAGRNETRLTWMVCAFGRGETASVTAAMCLGGHARVGFENSLWAADGTTMPDNSAVVARTRLLAEQLGRAPTSGAATLQVLGQP